MSLNSNTGADNAQASVDLQISKASAGEEILTPAEQAAELAKAYDAYAKEGTLAGADLSAGGDVSLLEAGFLSDNTPATITRMAAGICGYWATCTTPGTPAHGGSTVISVSIASAPLVSAMAAAITGTTSGGLKGLFDNTAAVVKTFPCVIIEDISGVPTSFPELIT